MLINYKISGLNIFIKVTIVIGCEFLKHLSLNGISNIYEKNVVKIANDNIEFSNLNRQILFRKRNISSSKSKFPVKEKKLILILIALISNQEFSKKMCIFLMKNFGKSKNVQLML